MNFLKEGHLPSDFRLDAVYPNPFNGAVSFDYNFSAKEEINFKVYDLSEISF